MEDIAQAVERARGLRVSETEPRPRPEPRWPQQRFEPEAGQGDIDAPRHEIKLNGTHLESRRIISHDGADPRSRSFDMLRTQVLQSMDPKNWKILAVTSPTPGCGKTV